MGVLSSAEKFAVVVATATLNELEVGEYGRRQGLFPEQVAAWRRSCQRANEALPTVAERAERRAERAQIASLTRELPRKDRALAEAAAWLVLQKNGSGPFRARPLAGPGSLALTVMETDTRRQRYKYITLAHEH